VLDSLAVETHPQQLMSAMVHRSPTRKPDLDAARAVSMTP
jgi:hypothetical protein